MIACHLTSSLNPKSPPNSLRYIASNLSGSSLTGNGFCSFIGNGAVVRIGRYKRAVAAPGDACCCCSWWRHRRCVGTRRRGLVVFKRKHLEVEERIDVAVWRVVLPIATERRGFGGGGIIRENREEELWDAVDYISIQALTRDLAHVPFYAKQFPQAIDLPALHVPTISGYM